MIDIEIIILPTFINLPEVNSNMEKGQCYIVVKAYLFAHVLYVINAISRDTL